MRIKEEQLAIFSSNEIHAKSLEILREQYASENMDEVISKIRDFKIAIPSAALGDLGRKQSKQGMGGAPRDLVEKIQDIGLIQQLTQKTDAVSVYMPWDRPEDIQEAKEIAENVHLKFAAMNSTGRLDPHDSSEKSLAALGHLDPKKRDQAIAQHEEVIDIGKKLGSNGISIWLNEGSVYPGQNDFRSRLQFTEQSLTEIYDYLPSEWDMLLKYKPHAANYQPTIVPDWGTAAMLAKRIGSKAKILVDVGSQSSQSNVEQLVATLIYQHLLGGFHFNESKFASDDPKKSGFNAYQLFLIFNELIGADLDSAQSWKSFSWMIEASYNTQDPLVDLIQALEAVTIAYAKALLVDRQKLREYQQQGKSSEAEELLQKAYLTDVRPLVSEARVLSGGAAEPLEAYRVLMIRNKLVQERYSKSQNVLF
ncbi:sugar isomerase [Algoriphagus halophytocola]|uniref:sugar isomerase n=1 Tax=Algoriphagus halophytocola TaxID=2991499 RepID=UPI0022DE1D69|nr:sugar isomerase [Algoriphagus sp. TR-M9]WBL43927.1 sugar isomerase [Algoriphagus sp. TR-M9]